MFFSILLPLAAFASAVFCWRRIGMIKSPVQLGVDKKSYRKEYIRNQLHDDITVDQLSLKEFVDPFTGSKEK